MHETRACQPAAQSDEGVGPGPGPSGRLVQKLVKAAGAEEPRPGDGNGAGFAEEMAASARSVKKTLPMFSVRDARATVRWYESIGFTVDDRYEEGGELLFAKSSFGNGEFSLGPGGTPGPRDVTLWFFTDRVQELYQLLKEQQFRAAQTALSGSREEPEVGFEEDLYEPFYGGRQFSIRDNNGLTLIFWQPEWLAR